MTQSSLATKQEGRFEFKHAGEILTGRVEKDKRSPDFNLLPGPGEPLDSRRFLKMASSVNNSPHSEKVKIHVIPNHSSENGDKWRVTFEARNGGDALEFVQKHLHNVIKIEMKD
ncbi:MAG: hypothetical protein ACKKL6_03025 [Candidatus Komeilibacteria bacterium]